MPYSPDLGCLSRWLMDNPTAYRPSDPYIRGIDQAILRRLAGSLRNAATDNMQVRSLLRVVERCSRRDACASPACPHCTRRVQGWFSNAIRDVVKATPGAQFAAVTIVLSREIVAQADLSSVGFARIREGLKRRLSRVDVSFLAGVLEIELAEDENERYPPCWVPHLHGVIAAHDMKQFRRQLAGHFPSSELVPKPIVVQDWDQDERWPSYCFKLSLLRRIAADSAKRVDGRTGAPRRCRCTKQRRLKAADVNALMLHFSQYSIEDRFVLKGCRLICREGDKPRLCVRALHPDASTKPRE